MLADFAIAFATNGGERYFYYRKTFDLNFLKNPDTVM